LNDSTHAERNAFLFGWNIGYYNFVLVTAGKENGATLTPNSRQVLNVVASRVEEYIKYFEIVAHLKYPTSPSDARLVWCNRAQIESTEHGGNFIDVLNVRFGRRVLEFYEIGKSLITYAIIADRKEIEVQPAIDNARSDIHSLGKKLSIDEVLIDEILLQPSRIVDVAGLEEAMFGGQGGKPSSNPALANFLLNTGVIQVSGRDSTSVAAAGGSQVGVVSTGERAIMTTFTNLGQIGNLNFQGIQVANTINASVGELLQNNSTKDVGNAIRGFTKTVGYTPQLSDNDRKELLEKIELLGSQATIPPEQRKSGLIKPVIDSIAGVCAGIGGLAAAWATWGLVISKFFGF
jgi:hypothetical protein